MRRARRLSVVLIGGCLLSVGPAGVATASKLDFWSGVVRQHRHVVVQVSHVRGQAKATVGVSWQCKTGRFSADSYRFTVRARIRHHRLKASAPQKVNGGSGHLAVRLRGLRAHHRARGTVSWRATDIGGHHCAGHGTWSGRYAQPRA